MEVINWIILLVIVAIIAGALGFGGVASVASGGASILFWAVVVFAVIALISSLVRRN